MPDESRGVYWSEFVRCLRQIDHSRVDTSALNVEFIKTGLTSMKCPDIDLAMSKVLRHVFVNMPWSYRGLFMDLVVENRMNVEVGFAAADLESCSPGEVYEAVWRIRQRGGKISFHGPFWDLNIGSVDRAIREVARWRFESLFTLIEAVRPERVVLHTGFDPRHHLSQRGEWVENGLSTLEPFVRRAELLDSILVFENVFEEDPALHLELLERIKSGQVGFCLDVGHQHAFSKTSLDIWLEAVWPYLKEIHLHDNDSSSDAHLPVGSGTIDFDLLFGFLLERRIFPLLTIEPHSVEHLYETLAGLARLASFDAFLASAA